MEKLKVYKYGAKEIERKPQTIKIEQFIDIENIPSIQNLTPRRFIDEKIKPRIARELAIKLMEILELKLITEEEHLIDPNITNITKVVFELTVLNQELNETKLYYPAGEYHKNILPSE